MIEFFKRRKLKRWVKRWNSFREAATYSFSVMDGDEGEYLRDFHHLFKLNEAAYLIYAQHSPSQKIMLFIHLSNIQNSPIAIGGKCKVTYGQGHGLHSELLLQALEINRKLIAAICREWDSEEHCLHHITALIQECRKLELTVAENLKEK